MGETSRVLETSGCVVKIDGGVDKCSVILLFMGAGDIDCGGGSRC